MAGARPLCLSAASSSRRASPSPSSRGSSPRWAAAARGAGVAIATGDTKVVERGKADGVYINTTGVGLLEHGSSWARAAIRPGDRVLVSGTIGDHGMAIMIARGELELEVDLESDTAPLHGLVGGLLDAAGGACAACATPRAAASPRS